MCVRVGFPGGPQPQVEIAAPQPRDPQPRPPVLGARCPASCHRWPFSSPRRALSTASHSPFIRPSQPPGLSLQPYCSASVPTTSRRRWWWGGDVILSKPVLRNKGSNLLVCRYGTEDKGQAAGAGPSGPPPGPRRCISPRACLLWCSVQMVSWDGADHRGHGPEAGKGDCVPSPRPRAYPHFTLGPLQSCQRVLLTLQKCHHP